MTFYAHSKQGTHQADWQLLSTHLLNVEELAGSMARVFEAEDWARAAGLLHDLGKGTQGFQQRLLGGPPVDHSSAGAQKALELFGGQFGKLLAYALAGHHGGMPNGIEGEACLEKRLKKTLPPLEANFSHLWEGWQINQLPFRLLGGQARFQAGFFMRMVFSCLVDADFLDTEAFMDPGKATWRQGAPDLNDLEPALDKLLAELWAKEHKKPINRERCAILRTCLAATGDSPGLFSLTVPTGGGKTFASLAFALKHALAHGLKRVIYVIPYTSIIEQNAAEFRRVLGNQAVLEHHSNLAVPDVEDRQAYEKYQKALLACENWDAPVVVTTNVQFFESLFSNRPSRCRKLHNIAGSVIVLDEAQMLPRPMLRPCLAAMRELARDYQCSLLLMSATQPALSDKKILKDLAIQCREIAPDPPRLYERLRRVRLELARDLSDRELAGLLAEESQVLAIVNTRGHARALFQALREEAGAEAGGLFHLSALMYPAHRSAKLAEIREALAEGLACRVVSTQLVEAGVDVDFPVVYRAMAGLDSIVQAAGRCNREGGLPGKGLVRVFRPERGLPPGDMRPPAEEADSILRNDADPMSLTSMEKYFGNLYWREGEKGLDEKGILEMLGGALGSNLQIPFAEAAKEFRLLDSPGEAVLVGPDRSTQEYLIKGLRDQPGLYMRKCQPYLVRLYPHQINALEREGHLVRLEELRMPVLTRLSLYDRELGLLVEGAGQISPGEMVV